MLILNGPKLNVVKFAQTWLDIRSSPHLVLIAIPFFQQRVLNRKVTGSLPRFLVIAFIVLLQAVLISGCSIPFIGDDDKESATPPPEDIVSLKLPLYRITLDPGDSVPETQLHYVGRDGPAYLVTLDGLEASKRVGDSLNWRGIIAPVVASEYKLRVLPTFSNTDLSALGSLEFNIMNPKPVWLENPAADASATLHFDNAEIDFSVGQGGTVPGTPFVFVGKTEDGAQFSGVDGYPYRDLGDSLNWSGRLRGNVTVQYDMRVASIKDDEVRLLGKGELWITPAQ